MTTVIEMLTNLLTGWGSNDLVLPDLSGFAGYGIASIVIAALFGIIYCFFGYKAMRFLSTVVGLLIGLCIGYIVTQVAKMEDPLTLIVPLAGALLFAILGFFLYRIGLFLAVILAVFSVTVSLLAKYTRLDETVIAIVAVVVAVILAILAVVYLRPMVIVSTALAGGLIIANELFENLIRIRWSAEVETLVRLGVGLLLALIGILYQFRTTKRAED